MSTIYTMNSLVIVVTGVGQCVYDALEDTPGGLPGRFCRLVPGDIAWDDCQCGQLAQTILRTYPSDEFPAPSNDISITNGCSPKFTVAEVQLSLTRCVPIPKGLNNQVIAPSCDALFNAALILEADRFATRQAVLCCLNDMWSSFTNPLIFKYAVGAIESVGPEGQCAGITLTYHVGVGAVCCGD